jgi:hypothetical protein
MDPGFYEKADSFQTSNFDQTHPKTEIVPTSLLRPTDFSLFNEWNMQEVFWMEVQLESKLVSMISVFGCVKSKVEVIDKFKQIIKVDEWHKLTGILIGIILHVYALFFLEFYQNCTN